MSGRNRGSDPGLRRSGQGHADWNAPNDEAPNLFAWGSKRWITRMIRKPGATDLYGFLEANDQMPAFGADQLTENDVDMVARFLNGDYPGASSPPPKPEVAEVSQK